MIEIPAVGGTVAGNADIAFSAQRTVNFYPEADGNYKNQLTLVGFPGLEELADLDNSLRGGKTFKDHAVVVAGSNIYKIDSSGSSTIIGNTTTSEGIVGIDENGLECLIVDGENGYVWDGSVFAKVTDTTFTALKADSVTYLDSFFIVNRPGTGQIYKSNSLDALTWDAADTATAEYKSDHINTVWTDRELFLGGTRTTQVYWNNGGTPMPFVPLREGRIRYGIAAKRSVAVIDNSTHALFRDEHGGVFAGRMNGFNVQRISYPALSRLWSGFDFEDSYAFGMHWKGHEFYILTFPQADTGLGRTFGFDASTKLWFELGKFDGGINDFRRYPGVFHLYFDRKNIIGGEDGKLYTVKDDVYKYGDDEIISLRRFPIIHNNRKRVFFDKLQIDMDVGVGLASGQGSSPVCRLAISDDGGRSFKNFREKSIGKEGKHEQRVQFHHLGSSYDRVFQFSISDPVPRRLLGGYIDGG